jgi:adenylyltransferase/sulfurtransferase
MAEDLFANIDVTPREVKELLARGEKIFLVDVREPWEYATCRIEGATLISMQDIPNSLALFEQADDVVLFCHHGMRSRDTAAWLRSQGVEGARSMSGGIERWAVDVDPRVPRY